ncbi:MAG: hypothetical protein Q8L14_36005 [Myxococcales bacterium]|nr:hypothetical protein [Myxococcales bacterium]
MKDLRWLVPPADASVPIDATRIAFELEVEGNIAQVPLRSSRGGSALPYPVDGGRVTGWFDLGLLDAGVFELFAGWPDGPDASVAVRIAPERSVEIVGANPPDHGVNTDTFQPNDPDGPAWRRDDLVPIRPWPGSSVTARHARPGAAGLVVDAGGSGDGGSFLRLQDVEFNAFRDEIELAAIGGFWEAPPQRLMVTRWRWQRVVGGVPRPLQIHQPRPAEIWTSSSPPLVGIVVGTRDTETTGTLVQFDSEGMPTSAFAGWGAAVTIPYLSQINFVAGVDADGGFVQSSTFRIQRVAAPIVLAASVYGEKMIGITADGRFLLLSSVLRDASLNPGCDFAGARLVRLVSGFGLTIVSTDQGVMCSKGFDQDAGFIGLRIRPSSLAGPSHESYVTASTGEAWQFINSATTYFPSPAGPQNADYILREGGTIFSATRTGLEVYTGSHSGAAPFSGQLSSSLPLFAPLAASPVLRPRPGGWLLLAVDTTGTLRSVEAPSLREQWMWRPDGGITLNAPLGFSPSRTKLGSLLLIVESRLLNIISDGAISDMPFGSWWMEGGSVTGCNDGCGREPGP